MRILYLTNIPSPYRIDFFNKLSEKNEVTVLFERPFDKDRNKNWTKNKQIKFNAVHIEKKRDIIKYLNLFKKDIIVITNYSDFNETLAIFYMKMKKIKFFLEIDGGIIKNDNYLKKFLKKYLISSASRYLSPSSEADNYLINYGAKKEKIFRYNFSSVTETDLNKNLSLLDKKNELKKQLKITEDKVIIAVGQFIYRKGFDILIKASSKISGDVGIYIIGDNPSKEYIDLCENVGTKNIHFVGFQDSESLKNYYVVSDLFVLPTREDIWGLVINEAISFGLPTITTNNCLAGLALIEDGQNGYIVDVDNVEQLASVINQVITDDNLQQQIRKNNLELAKEYTIENMTTMHEKIFGEFC